MNSAETYKDHDMTTPSTPADREISIETRNGETALEYQVRLTIGVQSFDICQPRETMAEATWLVEQFGKALDAAAPAVPAEPVAWLHEAQEPDSPPLTLLSRDDANPWAHWRDDHKAKCVFKSTPLYASPAASPSVLRQAMEALELLFEDAEEGPYTVIDDDVRTRLEEALSALREELAARPAETLREQAERFGCRLPDADDPEDYGITLGLAARPVALSDERRNAIADRAFAFFDVPPRERQEGLAAYIIQLTEEALAASAPAVPTPPTSDALAERQRCAQIARRMCDHYPPESVAAVILAGDQK